MSQSALKQFGKYELVRRLAFGGMAEIFLARLRGEGGFSKKLVVKRILPQFGEDEQFVRMFVDEAVLAAHINHPNVVQVYDFGSAEGVYFIAMEYVDGADLRQILSTLLKHGEVVSPAQVAALGEGVAAGLASAHEATDPEGRPLKLVHRDVSPHNIMLSRAGDVKVMDFGIARAEVRATKTATGTIKGKVAYMAPEHGSGGRADGRSDQFSLGAVLWECCSGERLYGGETELEVLRNVLDCRVREIREVAPSVPEGLAVIIMRMLARDPNDRFEHLGMVRDALSRFRFTLGEAGSVALGDLLSHIAPARETTGSGTLVLPESGSPLGDASQSAVRVTAELPLSHADTECWQPVADPSAAGNETVLLNLVDSSARTETLQATPDKPKNRSPYVWVTLLLLLVAGGWFTLDRTKSESGVQKVSTLSPVPNEASVRVSSSPSGATVFLGAKQQPGKTPMALVGVHVGDSLEVRLALAGHRDWQQTFKVARAQEQLMATLVSLAEPTPAPITSEVPGKPELKKRVIPVAKKKTSVSPRKKRASKKLPVARRSEPAQEPGRLFLRSGGIWFHVYLGERRIGTTPLAGVMVPAGKHLLTLKNNVAGVERSLAVSVTPGEVVRLTIPGAVP